MYGSLKSTMTPRDMVGHTLPRHAPPTYDALWAYARSAS